jgi:hypothetical protein
VLCIEDFFEIEGVLVFLKRLMQMMKQNMIEMRRKKGYLCNPKKLFFVTWKPSFLISENLS